MNESLDLDARVLAEFRRRRAILDRDPAASEVALALRPPGSWGPSRQQVTAAIKRLRASGALDA